MPTSFLSAIPGLSNIPNPLNIFNGPDDDTQDEQQRNNNAHSPQQSSTSNGGGSNILSINTGLPGPSRLSSILTRSVEVMTGSPSRMTPASAAPESSDPSGPTRTSCPRTDTDGSGSSASSTHQSPRKSSGGNVVIADPGVDSDGPRTHPSSTSRRRGMSTASKSSGGTIPGETRRSRRRIETFVLVKPPPTSAKNPLNLQVQLVVPARSGRPRGNSDASKNAPPSVQSPSTGAGDLSSTPSTPARQSFETPETVEKVTSKTSDGSTPASTGGSESSSAPGTEDVSPEEVPQGTQLRRRSSTGSQNSSSATSNASSASGKRIIPLYNLAVHNVVQPSVVTDAGTDSKVAKFLKRTLDIAGVGQLEPSEVWLPSLHSGSSPRPSFETSGIRGGRPASMVSNMSLLSPAVSRVEDSKRMSLDTKSPKLEAPPEDGAKKFFGKLFKKKSTAHGEPTSERRVSRIGAPKSVATMDTAATTLQVPGSPSTSAVHFSGAESGQVGHPTFGLSPAVITRVSSEGNLDSNGAIVGLASEAAGAPSAESDQISFARTGRPVGYAWTVRRWAKKNSEGWAAHLVTAAAAGLDLVAGTIPADGSDDVVFEWVKMRLLPGSEASAAAIRRHPAAEGVDLLAKRGRRPTIPAAKSTPTGSPNGSPAGSRTSLLMKRRRRSRHKSIIGERKSRDDSPSPSSQRRVSGSTKSESSGDGDQGVPEEGAPQVREPDAESVSPASDDEEEDDDDLDDGYESDPEDSETPWICSLYVKRTGHRQLLATLTPAPHHPKVVGVLKIPSQLKPVCLANIPPPNTLAPGGKPTAQNDVATRLRDEVALTEENLKDVVNVTAMWLVAREEFSGFGRKDKRKA